MKWVIFDGPVDALWIENMNTVLDDTQTLCLSNGERLRLKNEMRMVFEVDDLSQASPATVSRCGMVYTSSNTLSWRPLVATWIKNLPEKILDDKMKIILNDLFETHIDNIIELIRNKNYYEPIPVFDNGYVISLCKLLQTVLENYISVNKYEGDRQKRALIKCFLFSLAWSFGGAIDSKHHSSFESYLGAVFN